MRDTNFGNLDEEQLLKDIPKTCGELEQLEATMYLLDSLLGWCEICFNNEQEEKDYKLLSQAYKTLEEVHKNYKELY